MEDTTTSQLVVFAVGGEAYALPIAHVHEIIRWTEPRAVASDDPQVCGVISLRGKIVPVYDLAGRLGLARDADTEAKIVIVEHDEALAGIVVDDVEEVLTLEEARFEPLPTSTDPLIERIAKLDERLIIVLRADQVFDAGTDELVALAA